MRGKCIEEFEVGQVDESRARTITETDVVQFSWISGDVNPMHTDAVHSAKSPLGQRIAHGALGLSVATGLSASLGYLDGTAVAALGIDEWKFIKPILLNDTIRLRATVVAVRPTSKPDRGVLVRRMDLLNQHDNVVQTGLMTTMVLTIAGREAMKSKP
ncbi:MULTISPECIES: MaoC/PaaZ C-terminal domain-containing protein [unclassified Acidovorax]|uniref:MaoC/PaaZ C-terminal domain-containing protein n=1 Tax=unclassified Acidovorax TaxID=2684926 RepID=UPI000C185610|nr:MULTISPECIES: MaoC/PaaZ C-terminal domain-containing protein [unclassified Acidovorax]PIF19394.1 acyl dehydratase [Acidovorax sp. 59]PKW01578.1 acyl dehydratase [Acidovorax sp. 30]